ncbi:MAG: HDOD domain-containing protein, partial [Bdellovibrionales bacterium]|nr:HDOD domain-containing protein [Bdellovibrionales bacterium]
MSKPCDVEGLKTRIRNACAIRDLVGCSNVKTALSGLLQIPTIPQYYDCLLEELQSTSPSMALLEGLVLNDPGLTAKVLQISNSAFFGPSKSICNPIEALRNIGVEGLRGLTMNAKVISRCELSENVLSLPALVAHCHGVTDILERIFTIEPFSEEEKCQARTAGILHEIGRILLATLLPDLYAEVRNLIDKQGFTQEHAEYTVFGVTHPEIGAYLLALWGLPKPIVDAVAFHHNPEQSDQNTFNVLSALHVANVLEDELRPRSRFESKLELDTNYMGRIGKERSVTVWMSKCGLNS